MRYNKDRLQKITGKEVLNPRIETLVRQSISSLALTQATPYMLSRLLADDEQLSETEPNEVKIGVSSDFGTVENGGWFRFVRFDEAVRPTLVPFLGDEAENLSGQLEFARESNGASLHGLLRSYEYPSADGNAVLWAHGSVGTARTLDQNFLAFTQRIGAERLWRLTNEVAESSMNLSVEGYLDEKLGWPIARALGNWATHQTGP